MCKKKAWKLNSDSVDDSPKLKGPINRKKSCRKAVKRENEHGINTGGQDVYNL